MVTESPAVGGREGFLGIVSPPIRRRLSLEVTHTYMRAGWQTGIHHSIRRGYTSAMSAAIHTTPEPALPPHRSRWIPLSLKLFVAILGLLFVGSALWIGIPAHRQHVAIREIERLGGATGHAGGREWLRAWLGDQRMKMFDDVIDVNLYGKEATDATLAHLSRLASLQTLSLAGSDVSDMELGATQNQQVIYVNRIILRRLLHRSLDRSGWFWQDM